MIKNLKKLRQEHKLSQKQLADIVMVSQQSINKYENHNVEPDISTLTQMADFFDVSLDYLVGRVDVKELVTKLKTSDLTRAEVRLVKSFRKLKRTQQDCILSLLDSYD